MTDFNDITPVGTDKPFLNWCFLSQGELWLKFGSETLYEYTDEALRYFSLDDGARYNDYFLFRFFEDFLKLLDHVGESVPIMLLKEAYNIESFYEKVQRWHSLHEAGKDYDDDFYRHEHFKVTEWISNRTLISIHLQAGPTFSFVRHKNRLKIFWTTEATLGEGVTVWTAKNGNHEMGFDDFVLEVESFGKRFFEAYDQQVQRAIDKDWGEIQVDKVALKKEHEERKVDFANAVYNLKNPKPYDWEKIQHLYQLMVAELSSKSTNSGGSHQ